MKTCSIKYLYCYVAFFIISSLAISGVPKRKIRLNTDDSRIADKRETGKKRAKSGAGTNADTNAKTGSATASESGTESQTFTNTKVNTRIATSSNAKSSSAAGANAAAKVKTYAHANTETQVNNHQKEESTPSPNDSNTTQPTQPTPRRGPKGSTGPFNSPTPKPPIIKVYCPNCPCPCPPPCPCVCPCVAALPTLPAPPPCPPPCSPNCQPPCSPPPPCIVDCGPSCPSPCRRDLDSAKSYRMLNKTQHDATTQTKRHLDSAHAKKKSHNAKKEPDLEKTTAMRFEKAAVAADNVMCSKIGRDIMKDKKGSAVDAIIATHHCVEVVNLHSTGLGGGGFMLVYEKKSGKSSAFDFRETLPEEYVDTTNKTQGETILVPGVLRGLESAHNKYGKLPWKELFTPAIKLAEEGFKIHEALAAAIKKKKDYIMTNLGLRELFAPNNELLKLGDILKRPKLAKTYRQIANNGAKEFYSGEIARQIIEDVKEVGGVMTSKDLASYRTIERGPLRTTVGGFEMLTTPPPGAGSLLALALKIMDGYNWTAKDLKDRPALTYHRIIEAMKFAYAPFTFLGDPRYTNHTDEVVKYMLDEKVANNMRARIDNVSHTVDYYQPYSKLSIEEANGTSHMSALGPNGDAVSLTSSINAYFGSKLLSRELGFIYNNELADFSEFWPSVYNLTSDKKVPGKRPMSKSSPTIFVNPQTKNVEGVFGAAGGFFIPSCMLMTIGNWLFFHDDLKVAVSRPRLHCQLFPPTVVYEPTFPVELVPQLESYSHAYVTNSTYDVSGQLNAIMGVVQAITRDDEGKIAAESDYRKGGLPAGF